MGNIDNHGVDIFGGMGYTLGMKSLVEDLQTPKESLEEFAGLTERVLNHVQNVITASQPLRDDYIIHSSAIAGTTKYTRPVKETLFIRDSHGFRKQFEEFIELMRELRAGNRLIGGESNLMLDRVVYTIQQSIGIGLDLMSNPNSARKHVGNRFEELIRLIIAALGVANKKIVLKIPYSEDGSDIYSCETDLVFSPFEEVRSGSHSLDPAEVVVSLKTSSKDRLGKIFIDKLLMREFVGHDVTVVGIFLNDVQRKETSNISYTFVSGLFMVYTKFLTEADGMYFVDMPPKTKENPYNEHIFPFSKFIVRDIWKFLE